MQVDIPEGAKEVLEADTDNFVQLVSLAGLNPRQDFKHADLSRADFRDCDLTSFDFTYADLRAAIWDANSINTIGSYLWSLRGDHMQQIDGEERVWLVTSTIALPRWSDRFSCFAHLVDLFGPCDEVFQILREIVAGDKSVYMIEASRAYFLSVLANSPQLRLYCKEFAEGGASLSNMYRRKKLDRLTAEAERYLVSRDEGKKFPGEVSVKIFQSLGESSNQAKYD